MLTARALAAYTTTMVADKTNVEYVGTVEAAAILQCRRETVFRLIQRGALPALKILDRWVIHRESLERLALTYRARPGRPRKLRQGQ